MLEFIMILEQFIKLEIPASTKPYWESKGYICDIPYIVKHKTHNRPVYILLINVDDLSPRSGTIVTRICDKCGKIDFIAWGKHPNHNLCYKCAHEKSTNHQHCQECGKDLGYWNKNVKLCRECWRKTNRGENHPSWKPDLDPEKRKLHINRSTDQYKAWELLVKTRDNYTCKKCGKHDEHIAAHHIFDKVSYPDLIYNLDNGICLCSSCHRKFHSVYTREINSELLTSTPELLLSFLKEYVL